MRLSTPSRAPGRQLSLFKRRNQRGLAPPSPKEFLVQCTLADTIRRWCLPGWWWTALPFGEKRDEATAGRLKRMGVNGGPLDFMFLHIAGRTVWLELKRAKIGRLSDAQKEFAAFVRTRGDTVLIADNYKDAVAMLQDAGVLPKTIQVQ